MGDIGDELGYFLGNVAKEVDPGTAEKDDSREEALDFGDHDRSKLSFQDTLRALVTEFGGPRGLADHVKRLFGDACPANTKARILESIIDGVKAFGEEETFGDEESMDAIEDELRAIHRQEFLESLPESLRDQVAAHL